jgi:hypothetical protein
MSLGTVPLGLKNMLSSLTVVGHDQTGPSMLHVACCMLHVACCMLHVACCMLHVACCMLHVACCMLHVACCIGGFNGENQGARLFGVSPEKGGCSPPDSLASWNSTASFREGVYLVLEYASGGDLHRTAPRIMMPHVLRWEKWWHLLLVFMARVSCTSISSRNIL